MSYCRITGRARNLPKPNYFPLLAPISPADARRFCRITGKAFGLPTHCYIPVVLTTFSNKSKCKITNSTDFSPHHYEPDYDYGKRKHVVLTDYRYLFPVLDENNEQQINLINILNSKVVQCDEHHFIYTIKEQKCNLVFPAKLEAAVRDGDVCDVMFAKTNDSVLLCMNKGKSVSLDLHDYDLNGNGGEKSLFEGEGPRYDVLIAREAEENQKPKNRTKRKQNGLQKSKTIETDSVNALGENATHSENMGKVTKIDAEHIVQNGASENQTNTHNGCADLHESTNGITNADQQQQQYTDHPRSDELDATHVQSHWKTNTKIPLNDAELCESIPNQNEIFKIMQNYSKGTVVNDESSRSGLSINIGTDEMPRNVLILGCMVNTSDGEVFVAGRTVATDNGSSIFEPGICVQSKAGPTFIPGQIIYTEEEGERFVPGQIIDTEFGPRFVPGKILEVDGEVTFIPAQIVQTDKGPKFIAPDLCDDENGERKYSVQSFLLSPEEMTLLKPMHIWTNAYAANGDQSVDMNMFHQLSEAGLIVGSQIEVSDLNVDALLQNTINEQIIRKFAENLEWTNVKQPINVLTNIFEKIKMLIGAAQQEKNKILNASPDAMILNGFESYMETENECPITENINYHLIDMISRTVIDCVNQQRKKDILCGQNEQHTDSNPFLYGTISQILSKNLKQYFKISDTADDTNDCIGIIDKLLAAPDQVHQIECNVKTLAVSSMQTNKIDLIRAMISGESNKINSELKIEHQTETSINILDNIRNIMQNETIDELFESVQNLISHEPSLMHQIVNEMHKFTENLINENSVAEILRKSIVSVVQKSTNDDIKKIASNPAAIPSEQLRAYLTDTISLARALGFTNCILNVSNILNSNDDVIDQLENDANSFELLQRVVVMHKLSQNDEQRQKALESLRRDPYSARSDLVLRELLRCSGICTINVEENNKLKDSNDVPISLIYSKNELAIEDFFMRRQTKPSGPILIVKDRFQAVVPRESSRDVLTGKCAYTVLDENGIRHFEPLHMFTALKLKNVPMFEHRFASYTNADKTNDAPTKDCDIDLDSILNMGAIRTASNNSYIAYKSTILPKKEFDHIFTKRRLPLQNGLFFDKSQVNYRRSFYL